MEEFLNTIYSYEYFGFYLIMAIIVLVILFLVILFFGKKDQKNREIEATKKLEQINTDTFKEEPIEEKLEINEPNKETNLEDTIVVSNIEDMPTLNYVEDNEEIPEPVLPTMENIEEKVEEKTDIYEPILDKIEEKPLVLDNTNTFTNEFISQVVENNNIENIDIVKEEVFKEEIEVPEFNLENIMKDIEDVKEVEVKEKQINNEPIFSSVYVPEKEELEPVKEEIPVEKAMEDLEFELPSLKKEETEESNREEIEVPVLKDYNLDELSGETYNINK